MMQTAPNFNLFAPRDQFGQVLLSVNGRLAQQSPKQMPAASQVQPNVANATPEGIMQAAQKIAHAACQCRPDLLGATKRAFSPKRAEIYNRCEGDEMQRSAVGESGLTIGIRKVNDPDFGGDDLWPSSDHYRTKVVPGAKRKYTVPKGDTGVKQADETEDRIMREHQLSHIEEQTRSKLIDADQRSDIPRLHGMMRAARTVNDHPLAASNILIGGLGAGMAVPAAAIGAGGGLLYGAGKGGLKGAVKGTMRGAATGAGSMIGGAAGTMLGNTLEHYGMGHPALTGGLLGAGLVGGGYLGNKAMGALTGPVADEEEKKKEELEPKLASAAGRRAAFAGGDPQLEKIADAMPPFFAGFLAECFSRGMSGEAVVKLAAEINVALPILSGDMTIKAAGIPGLDGLTAKFDAMKEHFMPQAPAAAPAAPAAPPAVPTPPAASEMPAPPSSPMAPPSASPSPAPTPPAGGSGGGMWGAIKDFGQGVKQKFDTAVDGVKQQVKQTVMQHDPRAQAAAPAAAGAATLANAAAHPVATALSAAPALLPDGPWMKNPVVKAFASAGQQNVQELHAADQAVGSMVSKVTGQKVGGLTDALSYAAKTGANAIGQMGVVRAISEMYPLSHEESAHLLTNPDKANEFFAKIDQQAGGKYGQWIANKIGFGKEWMGMSDTQKWLVMAGAGAVLLGLVTMFVNPGAGAAVAGGGLIAGGLGAFGNKIPGVQNFMGQPQSTQILPGQMTPEPPQVNLPPKQQGPLATPDPRSSLANDTQARMKQ